MIIDDKPIGLLYHYTDAKGLLGIFDTKEIWASNLNFTNDGNELIIATKIFNELLYKNDLIQTKGGQKKELSKLVSKFSYVRVFGFSLCDKEDLLGQWRGYSNGVGGYSIGFDYSILKSIEKENIKILKCIYKVDDQIKLIQEIINETVLKRIDEMDPIELLSPAIDITDKILPYAPILKDYHFSEENEWRIVITDIIDDDQNYHFRSSNGILPYYTLNINDIFNQAIKKIVIGPCPDMNKSIQAVTELLKRYEFKNVDEMITVSKVPYRK